MQQDLYIDLLKVKSYWSFEYYVHLCDNRYLFVVIKSKSFYMIAHMLLTQGTIVSLNESIRQ